MTRHEVENIILEQGEKICESIFEGSSEPRVQQSLVISPLDNRLGQPEIKKAPGISQRLFLGLKASVNVDPA